MTRIVFIALTAVLIWCNPAVAQINVPYFSKLSKYEVCGGFNSYCQPASSRKYHVLRGADFGGLDEWLGVSYNKTAFQRTPCIGPFSKVDDVRVSGEQSFSASFDKKYNGRLRSVLNADIATYLGAVLTSLPAGLQAKLKADATDKLTTSDNGKANFRYRRYDLTMAAMSNLLSDCYAKTKGKRKVITGVSVIEMSGDWARDRLIDSFGTIEASADFIGLSTEVKTAYTDARKKAANGTFQPLAFVIATAWRTSD